MGTALLVAAISMTSLQSYVSGSDHMLRIRVDAGISNAADARPPLHLLFGGKHPLKWDAAKEREMLELAVAAIETTSEGDNRANAIYSALWEDPPAGRENLIELRSLGVKQG
jgi:hypothetical protein